MRGPTRDGTAEPVPRDQIIRCEQDRKINFPCLADDEEEVCWQVVLKLLNVMTIYMLCVFAPSGIRRGRLFQSLFCLISELLVQMRCQIPFPPASDYDCLVVLYTRTVPGLLLFLLLFLTFSVLVANPKKLLYTVANPARGLLMNRELETPRSSLIHILSACRRNLSEAYEDGVYPLHTVVTVTLLA